MLSGSRWDGTIEAMLLKHWENYFNGKSSWNTVGYFYPFKDTLGYNDGYFLYGVAYTLFRYLGGDIILSSELVNVTLKTLGFIGFYILCRRAFNVSFLYSLTGAVIFTLANNLVAQSVHAQLLSISISPFLTYLLYRYINFLFIKGDKKNSIIFGCSSGILLACWLITTYYMAWFFVFFSVIFSAIFITLFIFNYKSTKASIQFNLASVLIPAITTLIALIPFLLVYLPKAKETGMHGFYEVGFYAPRILNILNPGNGNILFGSISAKIFNTLSPGAELAGEFNIGFPPVILIFSLFILVAVWFKRNASLENMALRSLTLSILISIILMVKVGDHTLWKFVWEFFPGAKGMRVTARFALFLIFPMAVLISIYLSKFCSQNMIFYSLALILMLEQVNISKYQDYDRPAEMKFYNNIATPPIECKSFFVFGQRPELSPTEKRTVDANLYFHNVDAMVISEKFALRTINGFSTFNPPGWDFAYEPYETYLKRVHTYAVNQKILGGLCMYDLYNSVWKVPEKIVW